MKNTVLYRYASFDQEVMEDLRSIGKSDVSIQIVNYKTFLELQMSIDTRLAASVAGTSMPLPGPFWLVTEHYSAFTICMLGDTGVGKSAIRSG